MATAATADYTVYLAAYRPNTTSADAMQLLGLVQSCYRLQVAGPGISIWGLKTHSKND